MAKHEGPSKAFKAQFVDVLKIVEKHSKNPIYRDFEGFADGSEVLKACQSEGVYAWDQVCDPETSPEVRYAIRAITMNLVFESIDLADVIPTYLEVSTIAGTVKVLLEVRYWSRVEDKDIEELLKD